MAIPEIAHFSEARVAGADGAYTDQVILVIVDTTPSSVVRCAHDLGRIPDWVRVTALALDNLPPAGFVLPVVKTAVNPTSGRFEWEDTVGGGGGTIDPAEEILLNVYCPTSAPVAKNAYFLVEFGLTHSVPK